VVFALIPHAAPGDIAARAVISPLFTLVVEFVQLNVLLAVFNMIPVPPLDGGNVLLGVLPHAGARVVEQLRPYGFLILYALMLTGTLGYLLGPVAFAILRVLLRIP
jgi:Zn-dependent protease